MHSLLYNCLMKEIKIAMLNISKKIPKSIVAVFIAVFLSILISCGNSTSSYCTPNFVQGGVGMRVTYLVGSMNEFQFQVCYNDNFVGSQVSVYGVQLQSDIAGINTSTDVRLEHLTDGLNPGESFSVTFNNSDAWFVIYEDDNLGNLDNTSEVLRGEFR